MSKLYASNIERLLLGCNENYEIASVIFSFFTDALFRFLLFSQVVESKRPLVENSNLKPIQDAETN